LPKSPELPKLVIEKQELTADLRGSRGSENLPLISLTTDFADATDRLALTNSLLPSAVLVFPL
jgi:hypothetical protein